MAVKRRLNAAIALALCLCMLQVCLAAAEARNSLNGRTRYEAPLLGLTFDGPAGWQIEAQDAHRFVLRNPVVEYGSQATFSVYSGEVPAPYDEELLILVVRNMLSGFEAGDDVAAFTPSMTALRTLLGEPGVYANYKATLTSGAVVRGRVHAVCVKQRLYLVHITAPDSLWDVYKESVFDRFRNTARLTTHVQSTATPEPAAKPIPTVKPAGLEDGYRTYEAVKLGVSFEGPAGWLVDTSSISYYSIQNPAPDVYPATLSIHVEKVSVQYTENELKSVVKGMLSGIGAVDAVKRFMPSITISRTLLGDKGVYAVYKATLADGMEVSGCVHAVCVDQVLYTVHLTAPDAQWEQYKLQVYSRFCKTLRLNK